MDTGYLIWLYLLALFTKVNNLPKGVCMRNNTTYCCQNYYNTSLGCKECLSGFISMAGRQCYPCKAGFYGKRCMDRCSCSIYESCDNVHGCIQKNETSTYSVEQSSMVKTAVITYGDTGTYYPNEHDTRKATSEGDSASYKGAKNTRTPTSQWDSASNGGTKGQTYSLLIYISCSGGLILCTGLLIFIRRHRQNIRCFGQSLTHEKTTFESEANENAQNSTLERHDSIYDIIDELHVEESLNS